MQALGGPGRCRLGVVRRPQQVHHSRMIDRATERSATAGASAIEAARVLLKFVATCLAGLGIIAALVWLAIIVLLASTGI